MWKVLLLHQFHDDLPGSSIPQVYEDTLYELKNLAEETEDTIEQVAGLITEQIQAPVGGYPFVQ